MLGVDIDHAEGFHLVAFGPPGDAFVEVVRVDHEPGALDARIAGQIRLHAPG